MSWQNLDVIDVDIINLSHETHFNMPLMLLGMLLFFLIVREQWWEDWKLHLFVYLK